MPDLDEFVEYAVLAGIALGHVNLAYGVWHGVFSAWMALWAGVAALALVIMFFVSSLTHRARILFRESDGETVEHWGLVLGSRWRPGSWAVGVWRWTQHEDEETGDDA